jgi:hypothetical protein
VAVQRSRTSPYDLDDLEATAERGARAAKRPPSRPARSRGEGDRFRWLGSVADATIRELRER